MIIPKLCTPLFFVLFLLSCEGGTTFTKVVENNSSESFALTLFPYSLSKGDTFDIGPGQTKTIFIIDHLGKFVDESYQCTLEIDSVSVALSNGKFLKKSLLDNNNWDRESKGGRNSMEKCTFVFSDEDLE